jgi:hypothetical protein
MRTGLPIIPLDAHLEVERLVPSAFQYSLRTNAPSLHTLLIRAHSQKERLP